MHSDLPSRPVSQASRPPEDLQAFGDRSQAGVLRDARPLLRIDGAFEAALGAFLLLRSATGLSSVVTLPYPATAPVVAVVGILLLALLPLLWWISRGPRRWIVATIAAANGAGAIIFALWVLIWNGAFGAAGAALVLIVAGVLALLALLQACSAPVAA